MEQKTFPPKTSANLQLSSTLFLMAIVLFLVVMFEFFVVVRVIWLKVASSGLGVVTPITDTEAESIRMLNMRKMPD